MFDSRKIETWCKNGKNVSCLARLPRNLGIVRLPRPPRPTPERRTTGPSSSFFSLRLCIVFIAVKMSCLSSNSSRSLSRMPLSRQCSLQIPIGGKRVLHTSPKSLSHEEKTFRGQLYESTARRIQAQRQAEARFASMVPISNSARNWAFTFCMHASAAETSTADFRSNCILMCRSLLVRKQET